MAWYDKPPLTRENFPARPMSSIPSVFNLGTPYIFSSPPEEKDDETEAEREHREFCEKCDNEARRNRYKGLQRDYYETLGRELKRLRNQEYRTDEEVERVEEIRDKRRKIREEFPDIDPD